MSCAINKGVRIHYEVEGIGPPLVLHHGFAGCGEDWRDFGLAAPLARHNRLIILDARGCGDSNKRRDSAPMIRPPAPVSRSAVIGKQFSQQL
jgi:pimeloyl-ACP methyl ester carboxylesterase